MSYGPALVHRPQVGDRPFYLMDHTLVPPQISLTVNSTYTAGHLEVSHSNTVLSGMEPATLCVYYNKYYYTTPNYNTCRTTVANYCNNGSRVKHEHRRHGSIQLMTLGV